MNSLAAPIEMFTLLLRDSRVLPMKKFDLTIPDSTLLYKRTKPLDNAMMNHKSIHIPLLLFLVHHVSLTTHVIAEEQVVSVQLSESHSNGNGNTEEEDGFSMINVRSHLELLKRIHEYMPVENDDRKGLYSINYDWVRPICREICEAGIDALPVLIDYLNCGEYLYQCIPGGSDGSLVPRTLGFEARNMFKRIADPKEALGYGGFLSLTSSPPAFIPPFFMEHDINEWWKSNSDKALLEIQKDIVQWYIQELNALNWESEEDRDFYMLPMLELQKQLPVAVWHYSPPHIFYRDVSRSTMNEESDSCSADDFAEADVRCCGPGSSDEVQRTRFGSAGN